MKRIPWKRWNFWKRVLIPYFLPLLKKENHGCQLHFNCSQISRVNSGLFDMERLEHKYNFLVLLKKTVVTILFELCFFFHLIFFWFGNIANRFRLGWYVGYGFWVLESWIRTSSHFRFILSRIFHHATAI